MEIKEILKKVDHTLLKPEADWPQIKTLCDEGIRYGVASVCIPPRFVRQTKEYVGNSLKICTVAGFPNGYNSSEVKAFETKSALADGADEIDMVIAVGALKEGNTEYVVREVRELTKICHGEGKIIKVIIETCLLTEAEKIAMCGIVTDAEADFIKTSTGFSFDGATREDIRLFAAHIGSRVKMKAAGGIRSLRDAEDFLTLGCERLGTSAIVRLAKETEIETKKE